MLGMEYSIWGDSKGTRNGGNAAAVWIGRTEVYSNREGIGWRQTFPSLSPVLTFSASRLCTPSLALRPSTISIPPLYTLSSPWLRVRSLVNAFILYPTPSPLYTCCSV